MKSVHLKFLQISILGGGIFISMSSLPLLELKQVNVDYAGIPALWDVNLCVKEGECVSLVGVNGAGKTTLLKTIAGIIHPRQGRISFKGKKIEDLSPHQIASLGIIYVPEGRRIFTKLTVRENLDVGCYLKRKRKQELLKKVYELFPILKQRETQPAGTLSGGEQQMLAIARGLMADPKLLLLDEISLGLAPLIVEQLYQQIKKINEDGVSVLVVDENPYRCLKIAHRAYVIQSGRIVFEGSPDEIIGNKTFEEVYLGTKG